MTIKTLVEFAQAVEDGDCIEYLLSESGEWEEADVIDGGDSIAFVVDGIKDNRFRIKQEPKKIDLSFLVGSGIDCEFKDKGQIGYPVIGELASIQSGEYELLNGTFWHHCRPRMNHWHSVHNLKDLSFHQILENAGFELEFIGGNDTPVEAFKITGIKEGYTL